MRATLTTAQAHRSFNSRRVRVLGFHIHEEELLDWTDPTGYIMAVEPGVMPTTTELVMDAPTQKDINGMQDMRMQRRQVLCPIMFVPQGRVITGSWIDMREKRFCAGVDLNRWDYPLQGQVTSHEPLVIICIDYWAVMPRLCSAAAEQYDNNQLWQSWGQSLVSGMTEFDIASVEMWSVATTLRSMIRRMDRLHKQGHQQTWDTAA